MLWIGPRRCGALRACAAAAGSARPFVWCVEMATESPDEGVASSGGHKPMVGEV